MPEPRMFKALLKVSLTDMVNISSTLLCMVYIEILNEA